MKTVEVHVSLFSILRKGRFEKAGVKVRQTSTVSGLLSMLNIPVEDVGVLVINGRDGTLDQRLSEGDRVTIMPSIGGG